MHTDHLTNRVNNINLPAILAVSAIGTAMYGLPFLVTQADRLGGIDSIGRAYARDVDEVRLPTMTWELGHDQSAIDARNTINLHLVSTFRLNPSIDCRHS